MHRYSRLIWQGNLFVVISTCLVGSWLLVLTSANGPAALDDVQRYLLIVTVITGDEHDVDDNAHEQSKALLFCGASLCLTKGPRWCAETI